MHKKIIISAIIVSLIAIISAVTWSIILNKLNNLQNEIIIEIPKGSSSHKIGEILAKENIIASPILFKIVTKLTFMENNLKAGEYTFSPQSSLKNIIDKIANGAITQHFITFPEGWTVAEITKKLEQQSDLSGSITYIEEGTLLPQTYAYTKGSKRMDIIHSMQKDMQKVIDEAWASRVKNDWIKTKKDLITLASIVEKETSSVEEMPHIASVYLNRLNKKMRLQADPTVIYGIKSFDGNITKANLKEDHPYNTYTRHGLPIGAIANPSVEAIKAVAIPDITNDLYFVADGKGKHVFAKTLQQHEKNVKNYLKIYRAKHK